MNLKPGMRLRSATDATEVVVVRALAEPVELRCGGRPMQAMDGDATDRSTIESGFDAGTQLGKRYADDARGLELLCTKPGAASLSIGDELLEIKGAKPLPSSD